MPAKLFMLTTTHDILSEVNK